ncbi:MAG: bifunctional riboflavin kinase/FAD synthetase [Clostridiales Family XIII bacterium]|jgi:riboflavin kinase/FMN adenylyltransferase|nr:bifunctional riboflavin kinase/FAD synthetase [Clostridiales Family XIII bacterium]
MQIFNSIQEIQDVRPTAVALGNFDGVHLGHAELIKRMRVYAKAHDLIPAVFTFSNHPQNVLSGRTVIRSLLSSEEKAEVLAGLGVEYLFSIPFDGSFHEMTPHSFIDDLLLGHFRAESVSCGFNFRFGARAAGHTLTLEHAAADKGFNLDVMEPFEIDDSIVSSTLIRGLIAEGKVDEAAVYLGRLYALSGEIVRGNGYGRKLGFPTANIAVRDDMVSPAFGVYVTESDLKGHTLRSVTNIGIRPTIGDNKLFIESNIFDVPDEDLYGQRTQVRFLKMIRPEARYGSMDELSKAIDSDRRTAEAYIK